MLLWTCHRHSLACIRCQQICAGNQLSPASDRPGVLQPNSELTDGGQMSCRRLSAQCYAAQFCPRELKSSPPSAHSVHTVKLRQPFRPCSTLKPSRILLLIDCNVRNDTIHSTGQRRRSGRRGAGHTAGISGIVYHAGTDRQNNSPAAQESHGAPHFAPMRALTTGHCLRSDRSVGTAAAHGMTRTSRPLGPSFSDNASAARVLWATGFMACE